MNINQRFKEVRIALNLTQKEFGERLNLKPNTVAVIESGRRSVTLETVELLCFTLDVNPDWLLYGTGEMFIPHTLDEELAEKFGEILSDKHDGVPFSLLKKQCLLEILNFDDEQWNNIIKTVARISTNKEIGKYAANLPVDEFDIDTVSLIFAQLTGGIGKTVDMSLKISRDINTIDTRGLIDEES